MAGQCEACRAPITVTQKRIKCTVCLHVYHSECINYNSDSASRSQWKCPTCVAAQRKGGDNSNTPVRNPKPTIQTQEAAGVKSLPSTPTATEPALPPLLPATAPGIIQPMEAAAVNEFVTQMESILDVKLNAVKGEILQNFKATFIDEFKKQMATMTTKFNHLEVSHNTLRNEHDDLKKDYDKLKQSVLDGDKRYLELQMQLNKQQQWARLANIEIVGLPETPRESPIDLAIKIAKHAGIELSPDNIESAHRVQPMQKADGRPKPIVVKLRNRMLKDQILSGLRKTRGINTHDIGLRGADKKFYVNEHLTPVNKHLLSAAKSRAKDKSYKFVWVRNCNIFLRRNEESPAITINMERDLAKIV